MKKWCHHDDTPLGPQLFFNQETVLPVQSMEEAEKEESFMFFISIFSTKHIFSKPPWMSHSANPEGRKDTSVSYKSEILFAVDAEHM